MIAANFLFCRCFVQEDFRHSECFYAAFAI
jgi:hypothetical protein